jgi:hypothetical protein
MGSPTGQPENLAADQNDGMTEFLNGAQMERAMKGSKATKLAQFSPYFGTAAP